MRLLGRSSVGARAALGLAALGAMLFAAPSASAQESDAHVLIYSGTVAHRHADTINQGIGPIQDALDAANISYDWEDCNGSGTGAGQCQNPDKNPRIFTDENLAQYDAIFLFNAGGNEPAPLWNQEQRDAIRTFVNNGGGIAANHLATDMGAGQVSWGWWDGVGNSALGTTMPGHPPSPQTATMFVSDRNHPSTKDLPEEFDHSDEHYHFSRSVRGTHHVLITLDETDIDYPAGSGLPMGHDHPVSWCRLYDGGRIWATAMGHYPENYTENGGDNFLIKHLVGGVRWAAGVAGTEGDCGGTVWSNFRRTTISTDSQGPIGLDVAEDGRVFWTEIGPQGLNSFGRLKMWDPDTGETTLVAQIPTRADALSTSEDGVLGMVLDPDFEENNRVYVYYSPRGEGEDWPMTGTGHALGYNQLSRFELNDEGTEVVSEQPILRVPKVKVAPDGDGIGNPGSPNWPAHSGGAGLEFDAEGNLYLGVGDDVNPYGEGQNGYAPMDERFEHRYDARNTSANTNDLRGKILRIKPLDDASGEPGVGNTYEIPEGNMFEPGTPNTKPEIYAMGFRQPFTIDSDPANPGTIVVGEYGPDAGQSNPQRGPAGIVEWNHIDGPGFYGWPFCTGDNSPANTYARYEYATGTPGEFYDCAADTVPNESPHNTGLEELPTPEKADLWFKNGGGTPSEFNLGPSSGEPNSGVVYRYDPDNPSQRKWPAYFDGSWIMLDRAHNWWREVRMKEDGSEPLRVNDFFQPNQFGSPTHNFAIPVEFGPDGALYLGLWTGGCCRTLSEQQGRIVRIDYVGDQADETPPEVEASVDGTQNEAGAYIDRATVSFEASDDLAGVEAVEYRINGGDWETLENENFSEPFSTSLSIEESGRYVIDYRAKDRDGNSSEEATLRFNVADGSSCTYGLSDEFNGSEIADRWTVRVDSPSHEATITDGQLVLPVLDEVDGDRTGPLAFVGQQVPDGDWSVTTRVTLDHETNWQSAGFMLWQSDANFVKTGFTADGPSKDQRRFELTADDPSNNRHFSTSINVGADFPNTAWIRMYREGDLVKAAFAPDVNGQPGQWQKLPGERAVKGNDPDGGALIDPPREGEGVLIGVYAGGHLDGPWSNTAAFDFVRFANDTIDCPADEQAPETTVQLNGSDPARGYSGDVDVSLSATDGLVGEATGVTKTEYRVDGGDWQSADNGDKADPFETEFTVSGTGDHTVEFRSTDAAGNVEDTKSVAFGIGEPRLKVAVKPKRKAVKPGKRVAFRVAVRNRGEVSTAKLRVCAKAPKRFAKVGGKACRNVKPVPAGKARNVRFQVKVKPKAKGKKVNLKFVANGQGVTKQQVKAQLKVKRR